MCVVVVCLGCAHNDSGLLGFNLVWIDFYLVGFLHAFLWGKFLGLFWRLNCGLLSAASLNVATRNWIEQKMFWFISLHWLATKNICLGNPDTVNITTRHWSLLRIVGQCRQIAFWEWSFYVEILDTSFWIIKVLNLFSFWGVKTRLQFCADNKFIKSLWNYENTLILFDFTISSTK